MGLVKNQVLQYLATIEVSLTDPMQCKLASALFVSARQRVMQPTSVRFKGSGKSHAPKKAKLATACVLASWILHI